MAAIRVVTRIEDEDDFQGNLSNDGYFLQWVAASKSFTLTPALALTSQSPSFVLIAPSNGNGLPTFRKLVEADLPTGTALLDQANAFQQQCSFAQVPILPNQLAGEFLAGPVNGSPGQPTFRFIQANDLPIFAGDSGTGGTEGAVPPPPAGSASANKFLSAGGSWSTLPTMVGDSGTGGKAGVVPAPPAGSAAAGDFLRADGLWAVPTGGAGNITITFQAPASLFTVVGSPVTGSGTLALNLISQGAHKFFCGPSVGLSAIPSFRLITATDLPGDVAFTDIQNLFLGPQFFDTVPGFPNQSAGQIFAGPASGGAAQPAFRSVAASDLGSGTANTGTFLRGDLTWAAAPGSGTVSSVGLALPNIFTVSGSPVTGTGTLTGSLATQTANLVFAGPSSGGAAGPTFRALVAADLPVMVGDSGTGGTVGAVPAPPSGSAAAGKFLKADGTWQVPAGSGNGTVTSVGLALPNIFTVSGSPVTGSGTLSGALASQSPNLVFVGPASGAAAAPTFRALGESDLPTTTAFTDQPNTFNQVQTFAQVPALPSTPVNRVLASPLPQAGAGVPTMRALDPTDIPVLTKAQQATQTVYNDQQNTFTQTQNFQNFLNIQLGQKILWGNDLGTSILGATSAGDPITVGSTSASALTNGTALQNAINSANPGDVINLTAGAQFLGPFVLPQKSGMTSAATSITLQSTGLSSLPAAGARVSPAMSALMPQLLLPGSGPSSNNFNNCACINFAQGASWWNLIGLEVTTQNSNPWTYYGLILIGNNADGTTGLVTVPEVNGTLSTVTLTQTQLSQIPTNILLDRCYVHGPSGMTGDPAVSQLPNGIEVHGNTVTIQGCYISQIVTSYSNSQAGFGKEAHGIWSCNGQGPISILNNYVEAATENIFFGGAVPALWTTLGVPSGITVKYNYVFKKLSWSAYETSWDGVRYLLKNLIEFKTGTNILVDTNVFQNSWGNGNPNGHLYQSDQSGWGMLFTPRGASSSQGSPVTAVGKATVTNNLFMHCCGFFQASADDNGTNGGFLNGPITVTGNLCEDMAGSTNDGHGEMVEILANQNGSPVIDIEYNTLAASSGGSFDAAFGFYVPSPGSPTLTGQITFKNNICIHGLSGQVRMTTGASGTFYGLDATQIDSTFKNVEVTYNVFYKVSTETDKACGKVISGAYQGGSDVGNHSVIYSSVGFTNLSANYLQGKDYRLTTSSPYHNSDSTGTKDPGANLIDTAIYNVAGNGTATLPTASISVNPTSISSGTQATLTWSTTNATSATINGTAVALSGSMTVNPTSTTTYTLIAKDANNNQATAQTTLTVSTVLPTATLTASSNSITGGQSVTLTWSSTNGTSFTMSGGQFGSGTAVAASGNQSVTPSGTTTYTFTVKDSQTPQNTASSSQTITVNNQAPTASLTVDRSSIDVGQTATLTWTSSGGTSWTLNGSPVAASGSQSVTPTQTGVTTYTFVATNAQNVSSQSSVTITVGALPTAQISASANTITSGQAVTITWSSTNGTSWTLNGSPVAASGSQIFNPIGTTTYTLVVTDNQGGSAQAQTTVSVPGTVVTHNATGQHVFDGAPVTFLKGYSGPDRGGQYFNVKAYGAKGDGVTDDTAAIQAAITAAIAVGGIVWLPPGNYKITSTLAFTSNSGLVASVQGAGSRGTLLSWSGSTGGTLISVDSCNQYWFSGFTAQNNAGGNSTTGILIQASSGSGSLSKDVRYEDLFFANFNVGIHAGQSSTGRGASEYVLINCVFNGCATYGVQLEDPSSTDWLFILPRFSSCGTDIYAPQSDNVSVVGGTSINSTVVDLNFGGSGCYSVQNFRSQGAAQFLAANFATGSTGHVSLNAVRADNGNVVITNAQSSMISACKFRGQIQSGYTGGTTGGSMVILNTGIGNNPGVVAAAGSSLDKMIVTQLGCWQIDSNGNQVTALWDQNAIHSGGTKHVAWWTNITGSNVGLGFFGVTPVNQPTVTGSKGGNAALASLMTALANLGLVVDSTT